MGNRDRWEYLLLIPAIGVIGTVRLLIRLVPDSAGTVVSVVAFVFSIVRIPVDLPTAEWVLGRALVFVTVLIFSGRFYHPRSSEDLPAPPWRVAFSGGVVLIAVLFEQAVGSAWTGFPGTPSVFQVDASAAGLVLLGMLGGLLVATLVEWVVQSGLEQPYTLFEVTLRSYVAALLAGLLIGSVLILGSLIDVLFVSLVVVGVVWILSPGISYEDLDELEELLTKSVSGVWGDYRTILLSVYTFAILFVTIVTIGAIWSVLPEGTVLLSHPVNAAFLLAVLGSMLLYVFYYTIRVNLRIYERVYNFDAYDGSSSSATPPRRVAGLLLPVPATYYVVNRAFPTVEFSSAVRPTELLTPIAAESLLLGVVLVGLNVGLVCEALATNGVRWRLSIEGRPFDQDEHVVPLAIATAGTITSFLLVGEFSPLDQPIRFVFGLVGVNFFLLSPYYGFYLIDYLVSDGIESDRLRWIAGAWGVTGIGVTVYIFLLFFTPQSYSPLITSTLGFILGLWLFLVTFPATLSARLSPLTLWASIGLFLLATGVRVAMSPLGGELVSTAYEGLSDPFSNPVDFLITLVIGWSIIGVYSYINRSDL